MTADVTIREVLVPALEAAFPGSGIALLKSPRNASCSDPQGICEHLDRRIAHLGAVTATGEG